MFVCVYVRVVHAVLHHVADFMSSLESAAYQHVRVVHVMLHPRYDVDYDPNIGRQRTMFVRTCVARYAAQLLQISCHASLESAPYQHVRVIHVMLHTRYDVDCDSNIGRQRTMFTGKCVVCFSMLHTWCR